MQINELLLKNFGKFHDRQIDLDEGINLIHGENESGKSTIHTFIRGMLFGIERGRGRAAQNDTFSIYEPWENPNYYSGILKFKSGEKHFRIERNFDKYSKKAELICEEDGEVLSVEDGDLQMLLGERDAERYDKTVSMSQRNAQMGESIVAELKNYATNYYTSGNGEIDLAGALEQLRGRKKILENEIRMEMAQKQQKREKLEQEVSFVWRDVHHLEEELERVEEELAYRLEKEEEKKKERQREEEHGKGVMDEIRPEKWRIHPMELLVFALVIVIAVILFSKPWNYLIAIVLFLAFGLYICKPFSWMELAGGAGLGLVLLWVSHVSKEQFGAGDAWIFFISSMFLGAEENMRLLLWSLIICGIYSMGMLLLKRRSRKERIAFAPFVLGAEVLLLLRQCQFRRGSLTVEASLIFPVLVLLLMFFLHTTISGFMQVEKQAEQIQQQQELDTTAVFWKNIHQNNIKEIITDSIKERTEAE